MHGWRRASGLPLLILILGSVVLFGLWRQAAFDSADGGLENALLDLRFRIRGGIAPPPQVAILAIDERTMGRVGTMAPLRSALADATERLAAAGPAAIAINLLLIDRTVADARLATVLATSDRVILAVATTRSAEPEPGPLPPEVSEALSRSIFPVVARAGQPAPIGPVAHHLTPHPGLAGAALLAHVNITRSDDRVAREVPLALDLDNADQYLPAMPLAAANLLPGLRPMTLWPGERVTLGPRVIAMGPSGRVTLNHYGPARTIETTSLVDLLDGSIDASAFAGRLVFIGATADSLGDLYATPFGADVPGVEVLATLAANIIDDGNLRRDDRAALWTLVLAILLAGLAWRTAQIRSPLLAAGATAAPWLAGAVIVQVAFDLGQLWLDTVTIFGALLFATALTGGARYLGDLRSTHRLSQERDMLSYFLSPFAADLLAEDAQVPLEDETRTAAILFVDLTGYTALAETMPPDKVSALLVSLHAHIDRAVSANRGLIVEFLGDGALATFGLREPSRDIAGDALACGHDLLDAAAPRFPVLDDGRPVQLRVSVHVGPIAITMMGGRGHGHFTVTGDTVNVASRLQDVAKQHGMDFVATRDTVDAARAGSRPLPPGFAPLTRLVIRGRRQATEVWALGAEAGGDRLADPAERDE